MAYTVRYEKKERVLFEGEFPCVIEEYFFKTWDYNGIELSRVDLRLRITEGQYEGYLLFDAIFERVKEGNDYADWDTRKMNGYSGALRIKEDTTFKDIEEWLDYIKGKSVLAVVKIDGEYQKVKYVKPYEISNPDLNF